MSDIVDRWYGKAQVRVMHVTRSGMYQVPREIIVNAFVVLNSDIEYTKGLLSHVVYCIAM
jgi:hypothetical protein